MSYRPSTEFTCCLSDNSSLELPSSLSACSLCSPRSCSTHSRASGASCAHTDRAVSATMKLLVVASCLDLRAPLGVTPSLWQLFKALAEQNIELVVAPYQG